MVLPILGALLLSAAPAQDMAVTRFRLVQVNEQLGGYAEDRLAQRLTARGFRVSTPADLDTLLGLERQKQLMGCADETNCMAEISAALGVSLVASGRLTRLGTRYEVDVRVISQKEARVVASASQSVEDESRIGTALERCADALADQLLPAPPFRARLWVPVVAGLASFVAGGTLLATAQLEYVQWTSGSPGAPLAGAQISAKFGELSLRRGLGFGLLGLGAALVVTGVVWNALVPQSPVTVALDATPGRTGLLLTGAF